MIAAKPDSVLWSDDFCRGFVLGALMVAAVVAVAFANAVVEFAP